MAQGRYLTLEEAAKKVGKPVSWIKNCICRGELDGKLEGRKWLVSVESLHKITPTSPPPKPETVIHNFLTPRPSRKASAEKSTVQDRPAIETTRTSKPTKKIRVPVSGRKGGKAEPKPNSRQAIELRIDALDREIGWLGDLLRKEMIRHGQAGNGQEPEGYGKAAKKLLRQWNIAREERRKLVAVLKNLDESGRVITSNSLPNASNEETDRAPIGGIPGYGYYPGRRDSPDGEGAAPSGRDLIFRAQATASARKMQDRGTSNAARKEAAENWAQARLKAEKVEREPKVTNKASARSPSPPLSASSPSAARAVSKGKRPSPPRDTASDRRRKTASEISRISRHMKENGHPAPLGDPASRIMLVVEQPIGPRVLQALKLSLRAVGLPEAYVTYASTGFLKEELSAIEPHALIAVGAGGARDIDATNYPLVIRSFSKAEPGAWFSWKKGTRGLLLPSLAPALDDEEAKRLFWRTFLKLKALVPTVTSL